MIDRCPLLLLVALVLFLFSGCLEIENPYPKLPPGQWRGVLKLDPRQNSRIGGSGEQKREDALDMEEVTSGDLPFLFDVVYTSPDSFHLVIHNGEEEISVTDIAFGLDRRTAKDTLVASFPLMDTEIRAICEAGVMQGEWIVHYKKNYRIPFEARFGEADQFTALRKEPLMDISGQWAVTFEPDTPDAYPAIAEFAQEGNQLTGTFRTETGDYRYLAGTIQANKIYLSCFDGSHAFLFEGKIRPDSSLIGTFRSGSHYLAYWEGHLDTKATLSDPHTITLVDPGQPLRISFPDPEGQILTLDDPALANKPVIIQILGTWCPNCLDESRFLRDYLQAHPDLDIAVIGIAFERYREPEKANTVIRRYRNRLGLPYPILRGGYYQKDEARDELPFLSDLTAYPTLLFLDKEHRVVRTHTGFNGPATSKYQDFEREFHNFVNQLASP